MLLTMGTSGTGRPRDLGYRRGLILLVTTLGGFLVTFMSSAINIALPLIEGEFHTSAVMLGWISLAYTLVAGAFLLPSGRLADVYGVMRVFLWGTGIFAVVSFASAFAPSAGILVVLRAIHGISLGIGWATGTALVIHAYPQESRGRALGINVAGIYLGLTLGPVLGGLIIHNLGWRSLFLVVGALGLVNFMATFWKLRTFDLRYDKVGRFDIAGSVVYAVGLTALLLGLSLLPDAMGVILIGVAVVGLVGFVWWETRAADPILRIDLFRRNRVYAFANAAAFINYAATFAMVFLLSLYLQYNRGLNAQTAGFVLVAGTFVQSVFSPMAGRLADRFQARYVASTGAGVCVLGLLGLCFLGAATSYWYIILVTCVLGLGFAFFAVPNTHTVMGSVDKRQLGTASAVLGMMRLTGQNFSMGLATLLLATQVGRQAIEPSDYPRVLTSVQISFVIFTVLCAIGMACSLVGPRCASSSD